MRQTDKCIGYLKYSGKSVDQGIMDARKSAEALLGFDDIIRYFILVDNPDLKDIGFEIPVRIRKGSWEAVIPDMIDKLVSLKGIGVAAATLYASTTAKKAAEEGLSQTGFVKDVRSVFRSALISAQWVIRLASHIGTLTQRQFNEAKIIQGVAEDLIEIPDERGNKIKIPKKYFDLYINCPDKIFSKSAKIINKERVLELGVCENEKKEMVRITADTKSIFYTEDEPDDMLFPELKHGQYVELDGSITRSNEKTNTIGFEYKGHILTCRPRKGNIVVFKSKIISRLEGQFFPQIRLVGNVDRSFNNPLQEERHPHIVFDDIIPLESRKQDPTLFD